MAKVGIQRSASLICSRHSFNAVSPARTTTKLAEFSSAAAYFLILNRWFCSNVKASDSGNISIKLGEKDRPRTELTALLKLYEFSEVRIDEIIRKFPKVLSLKTSTNLKPKVDYLVECGFSESALCSVIASNPFIFGRSLHSFIKPRYEFLKTYLPEKVNMVIKRDALLLTKTSVETCIEYLEKQGVPVSSISKLLAIAPKSLVYGKNRLVKLVEATKALGSEPADAMFVWYIRVFGSMNETSWEKKVEVFKSLGWSDEDVRATLLKYPCCFQISEEKLRSNMDFYIKVLKVEREDVIGDAKLLMLSLNERIIPRYEVMKLLKEYNLWESSKITAFFDLSEKRFMKRYVEKNLEQVPHLLEVYCGSRKAKADAAGLNT